MYQCFFCNYSTNKKSNINNHCKSKKHLKNVMDVNIISKINFTCALCTYKTNRSDNFNKHIRNAQNAKLVSGRKIEKVEVEMIDYTCKFCHQNFKNGYSLKRHQSTCTEVLKENYKLKIKVEQLKSKLNNIESLLEHYKIMINNSSVKLSKLSKRRKNIPKKLKMDVWNEYIGKSKGIGFCYVCTDEIDSKHFEAGHVHAECKGGLTNKDNLRPICEVCNKSISNMDMNEYKDKYYPNTSSKKALKNKNLKQIEDSIE